MKHNKFHLCLLMTFILLSSCKKNEEITDPSISSNGCEVDFLKGNSEFTRRITSLTDDARMLNYETGYLLYFSKINYFNYERIKGNPEESSIIFTPKGQLDGLMHSHYGNLYPNFSGSDIKAIYEAYHYEKMNDYQKFISVVTSGSNTSYLLKISDLTKFLRFSVQNLVDKDRFITFETRYHDKQKAGQSVYGINQSFENALLEMLASSGLTLYKSVSPFQVWTRLKWDQNRDAVCIMLVIFK